MYEYSSTGKFQKHTTVESWVLVHVFKNAPFNQQDWLIRKKMRPTKQILPGSYSSHSFNTEAVAERGCHWNSS
jgi:hypothetical protein